MIYLRYILYPLLFVMLVWKSYSQENPAFSLQLAEKLVKGGLENVAVKEEGKNVYIFYENRMFRWEPDALRFVFKEAGACFPDSAKIHAVVLHHHLPLTVVSGNSFEITGFSFQTDSVRKVLRGIRTKNRSFGRIDLTLLPGLAAQFGNYDHPVEWQVSLSPVLSTSLWRGNLLSARVIIPIHSELQQEEENQVRLGTVAMNQLVRLRKELFVNFSAGMFSYRNKISSEQEFERYGIHADARKYFLNSRLCAGGYAGVTGQSRMSKGVLDYWPLDRALYGVYSEYRDPVYHLNTKITAGKFLYDDFAVRLDLNRQFKEVSIGFFALKSDYGYNGGFSFVIPIAPRKQFRPAPARVGLANYYKFEYRASSVHPSAVVYQTDEDLDEKLHFLNAGGWVN